MAAAIAANPDAQAMFEVLSAQNRYALIFRLGQLKTEAGRAKRIGAFVDMRRSMLEGDESEVEYEFTDIRAGLRVGARAGRARVRVDHTDG